MFHIVLYQPEIPPNTGNIIRLCANTGTSLHLIHPLGFALDDKKLKRAGLDYNEYVRIHEHQSLAHYLEAAQPRRLFAISTKARRRYSDASYQRGDAFLFGPETRGLPKKLLDGIDDELLLRLPMQSGSRSLNLSNATAVIVYEAWRQLDFDGS